METLAPLDVFLFWSKCIPEHVVKPPSLATDLVLLNFFRVSRSLANEAVEHILTALSLSLLLLVSGTGIKISEINLFVSSLFVVFGECHWFAGAAPSDDEEGSLLFALSLTQLLVTNGMENLRNTCVLWLGIWSPEPRTRCGHSESVHPWQDRLIIQQQTWTSHKYWHWTGCGWLRKLLFFQVAHFIWSVDEF